MAKKIKVGIIFGGRSAEHEVSLQSAKNVLEALDEDKYEPVLIKITKEGIWQFNQKSAVLGEKINLVLPISPRETQLINTDNSLVPASLDLAHLDVVFPILHGPYGEDGTVQGLLKLAGIPFVGSDVLASAVGMDKDVMKRLLKEARIPIANYLVIRQAEAEKLTYANISRRLGNTLFIKPANLGSSVGISKVISQKLFVQALKTAFLYDTKILIEQAIMGREIECAILGNDNPQASEIGEIIPHHEFYSYEAKYLDPQGAEVIIPANVTHGIKKNIQNLAIRAFQVLCCSGMARVDFFLTKTNKIFVNEVNTIPGFTNISMYPKLWQASGISYPALISRLIDLAIENKQKNRELKTSLT